MMDENVVRNMSAEAHLHEGMRQLADAHMIQRSFRGDYERATTCAAIAQAHLLLAQMGVNEGRFPEGHPGT